MTPKKGTFRDPLGKWEDGTTRGVAALLKNAKDTKAALSRTASKVQALRAQAASASGSEAAIATKLLNAALKELAGLQKASNKASDLKALKDLQADTAGKLAAVRNWMADSALTTGEKRKAENLKKTLEKVVVNLAVSNLDKVDFKVLEDTLNSVKIQQSALPEELTEKFDASESVLAEIKAKQDEAHKFLSDHKKMLGDFRSQVLRGLGSLAMNVADRIGYGRLSVGNVLRGVGAAGRGIKAAASLGSRVLKGDTYVQRYLSAKRDAKASGDEGDSQDGFSSKLIATIKSLGSSNAWFQRRLLKEVEEQGKKKEGSKGVLGGLATMLSGLIGSVSQFFGSGGLLKTMAKVSSWLAPLASAGRFLLTRAMPVIGAFMGGWKIGSLIYEKYAVQIGEATDKTIGALKSAYEWVANKIGGVKDWASNAYTSAKGAVTGVAQSVYGAALGASESVGSAITSGSTSVKSIASTGASMAGSAASAVSGAVTGAYGTAGSYIGAGIDKLSSLVGTSITKGGNVDLDRLSPGLQSSMGQMAQEYFTATGKKLQINSGFRSNEEQARLYKSMPAGMAARPGSSMHNYGLAVDVQSSQASDLQRMGLLQKYGLTRPLSNEPWHIQPQGLSVAAAKAGIYSADSPMNQGSGTSSAPVRQSVSTASSLPTGGSQVPSLSQGAAKSSKQVTSSRPVGLNDIPTIDMSDGLFVALNLGVLG
jgi:hypothetical protein